MRGNRVHPEHKSKAEPLRRELERVSMSLASRNQLRSGPTADNTYMEVLNRFNGYRLGAEISPDELERIHMAFPAVDEVGYFQLLDRHGRLGPWTTLHDIPGEWKTKPQPKILPPHN